jgi:acyl dehydratase
MAMAITAFGKDGLRALVGQHLGYSDWLEITQERVNRFADATGDHQWIHVDPKRAASSPFAGPIAHGYFTLSLLPAFLPQILDIQGFSMGVNYGCNKVRFPSPVPVGARLRCGATLDAVADVPGGVQLAVSLTFETEGNEKPACVAEVLLRSYT